MKGQDMTRQAALEQLLRAFYRYYSVNTQTPAPPFAAEAVVSSHGEQYFLFKSAKLSEVDNNEYVFFALEEELTTERVTELYELAWREGTGRMKIGSGHRNSDVTVIILADRMSDEVCVQIAQVNRRIQYRFGFWGWSDLKLIAFEVSTGTYACNRRGRDLSKLLSNIHGM